MNINNISSIVTIACLIMVLSVDIYAMDSEQWGLSKSKSFGAYPISRGDSQAFFSASLDQDVFQFSLDEDEDTCNDNGQDEQNDEDVFDNDYESKSGCAIPRPRFSEVSLGLHKTDRKFLLNLLRLGNEYPKMNQFFDDLSNITDDNREQLFDFTVLIYADAVGNLDRVTQVQWREVLIAEEQEKQRLKQERAGRLGKAKRRTPLPVAEIPSDRWKSQKSLMARQLNVIMIKIFTELNVPHNEIKVLVNQYQSQLAVLQHLSSSWNSSSIPSLLTSDE